jgi:hypothetical protein
MQVKGTLLIDYVRIIRANPDRGWNQWLQPPDWDIINSQVLPSNWYPYDSFRRIGFAIFKVIANSDLAVVTAYGRMTMRNLLRIYQNLLAPGDPVASAKNLARLRRTFLRGDMETRVSQAGPDWLCYEIVPGIDEDEEHLEAFAHQVSGNLLELVEQSGGKDARAAVAGEGKNFIVTIRWK